MNSLHDKDIGFSASISKSSDTSGSEKDTIALELGETLQKEQIILSTLVMRRSAGSK
jgi:hypothetical protein